MDHAYLHPPTLATLFSLSFLLPHNFLTSHEDNSINARQSSTRRIHVTITLSGLLLEAGSRVPAPVYFEQSTRLLKVRN